MSLAAGGDRDRTGPDSLRRDGLTDDLHRDLALYQDTIATFSLPALDSRFDMLRQLGNVFIVQPAILKSYLTEQYLGRIENRLLRPYIVCRTDYSDFSRQFWAEVLGPDTAGVSNLPGSADPMASGGSTSNGAGNGGGSTKMSIEERKRSIFGGLMKDFDQFGLHDSGRPLSVHGASGGGTTSASTGPGGQ